MKLACTGKGGVGKTTIVALISQVVKRTGQRVLLIDADPDMNAATLTVPFFKMNPRVDDIPDKYSIEHDGIKLMVMGTIKRGGGGCSCPENAFLKTLLSYLVVTKEEWIIIDMEAGIEHLGRGTAIGVDCMLVVVEPNRTSLETAHRIRNLAKDLGIKKIAVIGNKITTEDEKSFIESELSDFDILGFVKYSEGFKKISLGQVSPSELNDETLAQIRIIVEKLSKKTENVSTTRNI